MTTSLAELIGGTKPGEDTRLRQAIVTANLAAGLATIRFGGSDTLDDISAVPVMATASVVNGDTVWVLQTGGALLILGKINPRTPGSTASFYDGIELYHPSSTPYIDFHRAANSAGDSNADYNARLINDVSGELHVIGTLRTTQQVACAGVLQALGDCTVDGKLWGLAFGTLKTGSLWCDGVATGNAGGTNKGFEFRTRGAGNNIAVDWNGTLSFWVDGPNNVKTFVIDHPGDPERHLVHACLEGPEVAVFYRGQGRLNHGWVQVDLPDYFEDLCAVEGRSVQLTCIADDPEDEWCPVLHATYPKDGRFFVGLGSGVVVNDQRFWWEVKAVRKDVPPIDVSPLKKDVVVMGDGPYTYYKEK